VVKGLPSYGEKKSYKRYMRRGQHITKRGWKGKGSQSNVRKLSLKAAHNSEVNLINGEVKLILHHANPAQGGKTAMNHTGAGNTNKPEGDWGDTK